MNPVFSIEDIHRLTNQIKVKGKGYQTNFYLDPEKTTLWLKKNQLEFAEIGNTIFLLKSNKDYFSLFYITQGLDSLEYDLQNFCLQYPKEIFVTDLIGRESEPVIRDVFRKASFEQYTSLVRMSKPASNLPVPKRESDHIFYGNSTYLAKITQLFEKYFDPYCEQIPSYDELLKWAEDGSLVIYSEDREQVQGFVIFEKKGQTAYLRYWFVHPEHREKKIGSALIHKFFNDCENAQRQIFWVIETNQNAIRRYEHFGFKREKLFDHVYINRSLKYEKQNS